MTRKRKAPCSPASPSHSHSQAMPSGEVVNTGGGGIGGGRETPEKMETTESGGIKTPGRKSGTKRKRGDDESGLPMDQMARPQTPPEQIAAREAEWQRMMERRREKHRRRLDLRFCDPEALVAEETFGSFTLTIEEILGELEEVDLAGGEEEDEVPPECLVSKARLKELCRDALKLKMSGGMCRVPVDSLVKLMTVLEKNMRDGANQALIVASKDEDEENDTFRELLNDRILRSAEAALCAAAVLTSPAMPKQVYLEDAIERAIKLAKFQLSQVVYPAMDPTLRAAQEAKEKGEPVTKPRGRRPTHAAPQKNPLVKTLYHRMTELVGCLAELVEIQPLPDTTVLLLSPLAISPFFVEQVPELQLNALRLAAALFGRYERHRDQIMGEILASLHRTPRARHTYRLSATEYCGMVTALVVECVQACVRVPTAPPPDEFELEDRMLEMEGRRKVRKAAQPGVEEELKRSYEAARGAAFKFLQSFLAKCTAKADEDYRKVFEAFLQDLLAAVHKPGWPAAELLLSLLGHLLVKYMRDKNADLSLRTSSLDYLGTVAARLRRDSARSSLDAASLDAILRKLTAEEEEEEEENEESVFAQSKPIELSEDREQILQRALVDYLAGLAEAEPGRDSARHFLLSQWYREAEIEGEPSKKEGSLTLLEQTAQESALAKTAATKQFLISLLGKASGEEVEPSRLSEGQAEFLVRWLGREKGGAFRAYLSHILRVLHEPAIKIRTGAMRCLTQVVEADPQVLRLDEVKRGVYARLTDSSPAVRETAMELIGKYVIACPDLIPHYLPMISSRILDVGLNVRKRVIKILREVCERSPNEPQVPEVLCSIARRVQDEEGIRRLVKETFTTLWFLPGRERDREAIFMRARQLSNAVRAGLRQEEGQESLQSVLQSVLQGKEVERSTLYAARQLVDSLVDNLPGQEGTEDELVSLSTLLLLTRVRPELMVGHAETLMPYLAMDLKSKRDQLVLTRVVGILERAIPLMDHPGDSFLSSLEDGLLKLVKQGGLPIVQAAIPALAAVVLKQKRKMEPVWRAFLNYYNVLNQIRNGLEAEQSRLEEKSKGHAARSICVIGLLCRYFDFDADDRGRNGPQPVVEPKEDGDESLPPEKPWARRIYDLLMYFAWAAGMTRDISQRALTSLGHLCARHSEYLMELELKKRYIACLSGAVAAGPELSLLILDNLQLFLEEEEAKMGALAANWNAAKDTEALKEMGDGQSGLGSTVIQLYLNHVLKAYFSPELGVRRAAARVCATTLAQGLVTPAPTIPSLIAMSTDPLDEIRLKAHRSLQEINAKYGGLIFSHANKGVRLSFSLHAAIRKAKGDSPPAVRGLRLPTSSGHSQGQAGEATATLASLYELLRSNRSQRRSFLGSLLKLLDEAYRTPLDEMIYVADNLSALPYQTLEEPLFVIYEAEKVISVSGGNVQQTFKELLGAGDSEELDEASEEVLFSRLPADVTPLYDSMTSAQGCFLLLYLKNHLKQLYSIKDALVLFFLSHLPIPSMARLFSHPTAVSALE